MAIGRGHYDAMAVALRGHGNGHDHAAPMSTTYTANHVPPMPATSGNAWLAMHAMVAGHGRPWPNHGHPRMRECNAWPWSVMHAGHDRPWLTHPWQAMHGQPWPVMACHCPPRMHGRPRHGRPCIACHAWLAMHAWPMHHAWPAMASMYGERSCRYVHSLQAVNFSTTICVCISGHALLGNIM